MCVNMYVNMSVCGLFGNINILAALGVLFMAELSPLNRGQLLRQPNRQGKLIGIKKTGLHL